jgi:glycosyltransferase involved in cell wall biosynthesis
VRILTVGNRYPPWSAGGYEAIWAGAVASLRAGGHSVRVLTTGPDPTDLTSAGTAEADVHRDLQWYWRAHTFPRLGPAACVRLERHNAATLARHVAEFRPDVVVWWAMGGMSLSLLEQVDVPALGVVGDDWMVYGPRVDRSTRLRRFAGRRLDLDRATDWLFISRYTLETAREAGWTLPRATVSHPGVDGARFSHADQSPWSWRLLYCGRVDPRKGISTAIEALTRLPEQTVLTVDGPGDRAHVEELTALARRLGVGDRVRLQRSDAPALRDLYASADALLFPVKWREPWGLVPLEAMSVGRPVVASRAGGGAAEYLADGVNCLQFEPDDAAGLAAAVQRLAADPVLVATLRRGGSETAARFSSEQFSRRLEQALRRVVAS